MPQNKQTDDSETFQEYLEFISDMLGGDLFPLELKGGDIRSLVSHRAIDYELICRIVKQVQQHNAVFYLADKLDAYFTLDALGKVRAQLLDHKGDVHQISLIDRIGELTVTFFNLGAQSVSSQDNSIQVDSAQKNPAPGRVYRLKRKT